MPYFTRTVGYDEYETTAKVTVDVEFDEEFEIEIEEFFDKCSISEQRDLVEYGLDKLDVGDIRSVLGNIAPDTVETLVGAFKNIGVFETPTTQVIDDFGQITEEEIRALPEATKSLLRRTLNPALSTMLDVLSAEEPPHPSYIQELKSLI